MRRQFGPAVFSLCLMLAGAGGVWRDAVAADSNGPAYLIVPFSELSDVDKATFLYHVVPTLTLRSRLLNTGTAEQPWYCLMYETADQAEAELASLRNQPRTRPIARMAMVARFCAAG